MHEALLSEAALPTPANILGLDLKPYSIGHELWLIRQGNPLAIGGEVTRSKLFEAVLICAETWAGLQKMNRDVLISAKLAIWKWRTRKASTETAVKQFQKYKECGSLCFKVNGRRSGQEISRRAGAPFLIRLQMFLVEHCRLSDADAWDYPLGLASMKWCAHWESEGGLEIYNDLDAETDNFAEESDAKVQAWIDKGLTPQAAWDKVFPKEEPCRA